MGRPSCCYKQKLRKGLWSPEEDEKLVTHITKFGHGSWSSVPKRADLQRCGKSCRLRWINYLRPDLKRGTFSEDEENLIIDLHKALGNRWSQIAAQLPGRTDNEIKNLWNSCLKKKLKQRGIDPLTHKPVSKPELENGEEATTNFNNTNISVDSVSGLSNDLNLLKGHNSSSNSALLSQMPNLVSSMAESSSSDSFNGNRSFFMDRYENPQNESSRHSDLMGCYPIQHWGYGTTQNPNPASLFTQQNTKNYSSICTGFPHTSMAATNRSSSSTTTFQSQNSSFDVNGGGVFGESNIFMDTIQEDIKWPEILRNPFLMAATLQNQNSQPFYNEIKPETQLDSHISHTVWSNNQQMQESSQTEFVRF